MGNSVIWYYPSEAGGAVAIDFGRRLTEVDEDLDVRQADSSSSLDLSFARVDYGGFTAVSIAVRNISDRSLVAKLRSLQSHLKRGEPIILALDSAKAWAGFCRAPTQPAGTGRLVTGGNVLYPPGTVTAPSAGDYVVIRSQNPGFVEEHEISSFESEDQRIVLASSLVYDHEYGPIMVRHESCWPVLRLPEQGVASNLIGSTNRLIWDFEVTLIESPGDLAAFYAATGGVGYDGTSEGQLPAVSTGVFDGAGDFGSGSTTLSELGQRTLGGTLLEGASIGAGVDFDLDYWRR